jgi:integrase
LLEDLIKRGLRGVKLIVVDDHRGLANSARKVLPEAGMQRCLVQLDAVIRLLPEDTKTQEGRVIYLRKRVLDALTVLHEKHGDNEFVFINEETGTRFIDIQDMWQRALDAANLRGAWFHDLRRSFVTNARRVHRVPESVVMKMSGHKTRSVFDRYNIVSEDDVRAAVESMDAIVGQDLDTRASDSLKTPKASPAMYR